MKVIQRTCLVLFLLLNSNVAFSDTQIDTNRLLNWAESTYPDLFSPQAQTQYANYSGAWWCFRRYPGNIYAGVVCGAGGGFTVGDVYTLIDNQLHNYGAIGQFSPDFVTFSDSDGTGTGTGQCENIPFTAHEGVTETLRITTQSSGMGSHSFTKVNQYLSVTNTSSVVDVTISDPVLLGDTKTRLTETYKIINDYLWQSKLSSTASSTKNYSGYNLTTITTDTTTYSPAFRATRVNTLCKGQTWTVNPYTETTSGTIQVGIAPATATGTESTQMPGYNATISSISESVTVPAGNFNTVQMDFVMTNGDTQTVWISTNKGVLVKAITRATVDGKLVTATTELIGLTL